MKYPERTHRTWIFQHIQHAKKKFLVTRTLSSQVLHAWFGHLLSDYSTWLCCLAVAENWILCSNQCFCLAQRQAALHLERRMLLKSSDVLAFSPHGLKNLFTWILLKLNSNFTDGIFVLRHYVIRVCAPCWFKHTFISVPSGEAGNYFVCDLHYYTGKSSYPAGWHLTSQLLFCKESALQWMTLSVPTP